MGDPTQDIIDHSYPPLPIPCPVPTTLHTARSRSKFSPPGPTPTNGPTVIKTIIYFVLSANATSAVPTPGGLEQRINSSEPLQGFTQSLPTKLHWQKLNFCLITDSWCIDTHTRFLLSCLAVLVVAFLFELALWTSRWYDRGLIARFHHLKTQKARSQSPRSRPSTSESEETIKPNRGVGGMTTDNLHDAANTTTANGTNSQDVFPANGHASSSSSWSAQPRSPPTTPNLSTPGNAAFKALSAGRQRVEGTRIILGSPDRSLPLENSPRSASTTSQATAGPSQRRRSTLARIENRPTSLQPPVNNQQESMGSRRKKNKKPRSAGVTASRNSPERAPLLQRNITGRAYTSLHDVAAAADLPISENILNDEGSNGPHNHHNENSEPAQKLPGIDEVGDPYTLFCGLSSLFNTLSNTLTDSTNIVTALGAFCRAILSALQVSLALALGLVVTTFNGYYLGCIVLGVFLGKLVLGMVDVACWVDVGVGFVVKDIDDGEGDGRGDGEVVRESMGGVNGNGGNGVGNGRARMSDYERGILVPLLGTTTGM
ncbi:MAG: hypothetical protein OHK93_000815 [Ramalina farinacea]|uniref:Copper transporter n=1 Tax=Ramalina farinacea TaxID=258253 RepID=A0AA43TVJ5_9LECA|nr:hypothetical protein [Ramalina farinacea]